MLGVRLWKLGVKNVAVDNMSLRCKVQRVGNHCPMWCLQVSSPHSSTLKTEATCFSETLVFIYQATQCHIPGGHDPSRYTFLALIWKKNHLPQSRVVSIKHRHLQYKHKWNETCSGVVLDKEVETIRYPSDTPADRTIAPQWHRSLCLIWIFGLLAQDHKGAVVLQLVCHLDACTSPRLLSQHSFLHPEQSFRVLNFIPELNVNIY